MQVLLLWYNILASPLWGEVPKAERGYQEGKCPSVKVAVELDGSGHFLYWQKQYDEQRTQWLTGKGIKVVRINNNDVDTNFEGVKEYIDDVLKNASHSPSQSAS